MKFKKYITEAESIQELKAVKAMWTWNYKGSIEARAVIYAYDKDDVQYEYDVFIYQETLESFSRYSKIKFRYEVLTPDDKIWEIQFLYKSTTGYQAGQVDVPDEVALQVFSSMQEILKDFISSYNPEMLVFSSKIEESSRRKLYKFLANKIAKMMKKELITSKGNKMEWYIIK